jgi:starch synthase
VLTVHNLPYQGIYGADVLNYAKIAPEDFNMYAFENYGRVNLLKGGLRFADKITTVSPHYAEEIMTPLGGAGLHWLLQERKDDVSGILNGIDLDLWNPMTDPHIAYPYDIHSYKEGKAKNKQALRDHFGLTQNNSPIFSMAIRLTEQKGIRMFTECIEGVLRTMQAQFIVLGDGEVWAQAYLGDLQNYYPGQISVNRFNGPLEHLIDAGSDFTLIPSIYEPCGLKQMYSQLYGTLPIVRSTGGLADTVQNYDESTGSGSGFKFYDISASALYNTIGWANSIYYDRPQHMDNMIKTAMDKDFSWGNSARQYLSLYNQLKQ